MSFTALASDDIHDITFTADNSDRIMADNPRKDRRDGRQDDREDKRDCRQEEGRVGDDKRECKQEERGGEDDDDQQSA